MNKFDLMNTVLQSQLKPEDKTLLCELILRYNTDTGQLNPSVERLCRARGIKHEKNFKGVHVYLSGLVEVFKGGRKNSYRLNEDAILALPALAVTIKHTPDPRAHTPALADNTPALEGADTPALADDTPATADNSPSQEGANNTEDNTGNSSTDTSLDSTRACDAPAPSERFSTRRIREVSPVDPLADEYSEAPAADAPVPSPSSDLTPELIKKSLTVNGKKKDSPRTNSAPAGTPPVAANPAEPTEQDIQQKMTQLRNYHEVYRDMPVRDLRQVAVNHLTRPQRRAEEKRRADARAEQQKARQTPVSELEPVSW